MKIVVVGTGYVGLSNAVLLAQYNEVVAVDVVQKKVDLINDRKSSIKDDEVQKFLSEQSLNLLATTDWKATYKDANYIIIATPTDCDVDTNNFDTKSIKVVIRQILSINDQAVIIIKSTVPVGYTRMIKDEFGVENIIFAPEVLREGKALHDNLYRSRIIIGERSERANIFSDGAIKQDITIQFTDSTEAEAIKLFSNTYLAM